MSKVYIAQTVKYYDEIFYCIPGWSEADSVLHFLEEVGDRAFVLDYDLFVDESAFFNIQMLLEDCTFNIV